MLDKTVAKEKVNRKKVLNTYEKSKTEYLNHKKKLDLVEKQVDALQKELDKHKGLCGASRKTLLKLQKAVQNMDLANASDVIFYQNSDDMGYIVDGKEYHLEVDQLGEIAKTPMLHHRRSLKKNQVSDAAEAFGNGEVVEMEEDEDEGEASDGETEELFVNLWE